MARVHVDDTSTASPPVAPLLDTLSERGATRAYELSCGCGRVKLHMMVPPSSYRYIEQLSVICQCHDCIGFPTQVQKLAKEERKKNKKSNEEDPSFVDVLDSSHTASEHLHFYKSDLKYIEGEEFIGRCRLTEKSPLVRFYSKCCGTPLGAQWESLPCFFVYRKLLKMPDAEKHRSDGKKEEKFLSPTDVVFAKSEGDAPELDALKVHTSTASTIASLWMGKFLLRALLGIAQRKGKYGGLPAGKDKVIGIGVESIQLTPVEGDS